MAWVQSLSTVLVRTLIFTLSLHTQDNTGPVSRLTLFLPGSDGTGSQAEGLPKAWGHSGLRGSVSACTVGEGQEG